MGIRTLIKMKIPAKNKKYRNIGKTLNLVTRERTAAVEQQVF